MRSRQERKADIKTIVLPETEDERTYKAAEQILKEGIAKLILVGKKEDVEKNKGYIRTSPEQRSLTLQQTRRQTATLQNW